MTDRSAQAHTARIKQARYRSLVAPPPASTWVWSAGTT